MCMYVYIYIKSELHEANILLQNSCNKYINDQIVSESISSNILYIFKIPKMVK